MVPIISGENNLLQNNKLELLKSRVESELNIFPCDLPQSFEIYGDLILLPSQALVSEHGRNEALLSIICQIFRFSFHKLIEGQRGHMPRKFMIDFKRE